MNTCEIGIASDKEVAISSIDLSGTRPRSCDNTIKQSKASPSVLRNAAAKRKGDVVVVSGSNRAAFEDVVT